MSLSAADYDYPLPPELIARHPPSRREDARMLVLRCGEQRIEHRQFAEFPHFLSPGDLVVLNDTRVIPARVFSDDRAIELLVLEMLSVTKWKCLVKPGRKMRSGARLLVQNVEGRVVEVLAGGERVIEFQQALDLEKCGEIPLPPYLQRPAEAEDAERYQTVFARAAGAIAAPTAGLHFTPALLARIPHAFLTLHVGVGTFRPVQVEDIARHPMHAEHFQITAETAAAINAAQRVIAIGTTTVRALESAVTPDRKITAAEGETAIFIHPPFDFQRVDGLLTNFHLPRSTLLMLVCAFAGREFTLQAYAEAVRARYRFYSYGDCMLLLP